MNNKLTFRNAERKDTALILQFIRELADYEKMLDEVVADEATLEEWIFERQKAEVIFAVEEGTEVGFALPWARRHLSGGSVRPARMPREGLWESDPEKAGVHCRRARLRPSGMVVP